MKYEYPHLVLKRQYVFPPNSHDEADRVHLRETRKVFDGEIDMISLQRTNLDWIYLQTYVKGNIELPAITEETT